MIIRASNPKLIMKLFIKTRELISNKDQWQQLMLHLIIMFNMEMLANRRELQDIKSGCLLNKKKLGKKNWWDLKQLKSCRINDREHKVTMKNKFINKMLIIEAKCNNKFVLKKLKALKHLQHCNLTLLHKNQIKFGQMLPHKSLKHTKNNT